MITVNIGLRRATTGDINGVWETIETLRACGVKPMSFGVVFPSYEGAEPTVVAVLETPFVLYSTAYRICEELDQECFAMIISGLVVGPEDPFGVLLGPKAHLWGEFDPTKFYTLTLAPLEEAPA